MFRNVTPESVGIDSRWIYKYIKGLDDNVHMHSVLMCRGNDIFCESYWKHFDKDFNHRMYSVTKSFMSVAVGLCVEDGLIDLDKPIYEYFKDKVRVELSDFMKKQTVRDMLTMTTTGFGISWFEKEIHDRTDFYLNEKHKNRIKQTYAYFAYSKCITFSTCHTFIGKRYNNIYHLYRMFRFGKTQRIHKLLQLRSRRSGSLL